MSVAFFDFVKLLICFSGLSFYLIFLLRWAKLNSFFHGTTKLQTELVSDNIKAIIFA